VFNELGNVIVFRLDIYLYTIATLCQTVQINIEYSESVTAGS